MVGRDLPERQFCAPSNGGNFNSTAKEIMMSYTIQPRPVSALGSRKCFVSESRAFNATDSPNRKKLWYNGNRQPVV